jgi:hypothetical protein
MFFLRHSDNEASIAHQRILAWDKSAWSPEMMQAWARCIMHLLLRHPDVIAELRLAATAIWQATGGESQRIYEQEVRQPGDPASFQEFLTSKDPNIGTKARVNMIIRSIDSETIGNAVLKMHWHVIDVNKSPKTLLTSDRPVVIHNLAGPDGWITLPVSPTKLFLAVNSPSTLQELLRHSISDLVATANERTVTRARRYVWARDLWQEWYVRKKHGQTQRARAAFSAAC